MSRKIRRDIHSLHPEFALVEVTIAVHERSLTATYRLDFRTSKHDACCIGIHEEVFEGCLLVSYLYRTLLAKFLFLFIHTPMFYTPI